MKTLSHSPHNPNNEELLYQEYVADELEKSKKQAADPDTQWVDHDIVWEMGTSK